jgi:NAD(P)-dependent dehydrogenase (short-subunit alcohol dehydrogenase family)
MTRLNSKTALITGLTDGVGRLVATRLGDAGARVLVHGRNRDRGERLVAEAVQQKRAAFKMPWLQSSETRPHGRSCAQVRVIDAPPSTSEAVPLTKAESSEAR